MTPLLWAKPRKAAFLNMLRALLVYELREMGEGRRERGSEIHSAEEG